MTPFPSSDLAVSSSIFYMPMARTLLSTKMPNERVKGWQCRPTRLSGKGPSTVLINKVGLVVCFITPIGSMCMFKHICIYIICIWNSYCINKLPELRGFHTCKNRIKSDQSCSIGNRKERQSTAWKNMCVRQEVTKRGEINILYTPKNIPKTNMELLKWSFGRWFSFSFHSSIFIFRDPFSWE